MEQNLVAVIAAAVAAYGAILSTITFLAQRREKQPRITVTLRPAYPTYEGGGVGDPLLSLSAVNTGHVPLTLQTPGIRLPGGRTAVDFKRHPLSSPYPKELQSGQSCESYISPRDLAHALIEAGQSSSTGIRAVFRDAAGTEYLSDRMVFEPVAWLQKAP